jgi:hypothetical protein
MSGVKRQEKKINPVNETSSIIDNGLFQAINDRPFLFLPACRLFC